MLGFELRSAWFFIRVNPSWAATGVPR